MGELHSVSFLDFFLSIAVVDRVKKTRTSFQHNVCNLSDRGINFTSPPHASAQDELDSLPVCFIVSTVTAVTRKVRD